MHAFSLGALPPLEAERFIVLRLADAYRILPAGLPVLGFGLGSPPPWESKPPCSHRLVQCLPDDCIISVAVPRLYRWHVPPDWVYYHRGWQSLLLRWCCVW